MRWQKWKKLGSIWSDNLAEREGSPESVPETVPVVLLIDSSVNVLICEELQNQWHIICIKKQLCHVLELQYVCRGSDGRLCQGWIDNALTRQLEPL